MKDIVEWLDKEAELVALDRLSEAADVIRRLSAAVDAKIIEAGEMRLEIERLRHVAVASMKEADVARTEVERLHADVVQVNDLVVVKMSEIKRLQAAYGVMMARYCEANAKITTQEMEIIALGTDNGRLRTDYSVLKQDYDAQRNALQSLLDEVMCFVVDPPSAALNHAIEEAGRAMEPKP